MCWLLSTSFEAQEYRALPLAEGTSEELTSCTYSSFTQAPLPPTTQTVAMAQESKTRKTPDHLWHLIVLHAHHIFHQVIGLTDQLHVSIFNPIVYHLHKVSSALISYLSRDIKKCNQQHCCYHFQCLIPAHGFLPPKGRKEGSPILTENTVGSQIHLGLPGHDPAIKLYLSIVWAMVDLKWMQSARKSPC